MRNSKKWVALFLSLTMIMALSSAVYAVNETSLEDASYGIIDADELQKMFDDFVAQYGLDTRNRFFSVGFCYLKTGDMWFYNDEKWYYSASLYKVPVSMLLAEREMAGEITADTVFENIYSTGSLDTLERKAIVNSNNDAGHALVEWMGGTYNGKCADQLIKLTDLPESYFIQDFYDYSYYSVNFYTRVLKTLYNNQQNYPRIIDYMKQAQPGAYLRTYLEGTYEIAQKYGAFEEVKANPTKNNNHAAGIIYTPNPIVVTVMTINVENFNNRIGDVAKMLSDYALTLDAKYDSYMAEKARAEQEEAERLAREEEERLAREAAEQAAAQTTAVPSTADNSSASVFMNTAQETDNSQQITPNSGESNSHEEKTGPLSGLLSGLELDSTQRIIVIAGVSIFVLGLILLIVALNMRHRKKYEADYEEDYDDEFDHEDEEDDEYLEPPTVRKKRKVTRREKAYYDNYESQDYSDDKESYYDEEGFENTRKNKIERSESDFVDDDGYHYDNDSEEEFLDDEEDILGADSFLDDGDLDEFKADFDDEEFNSYYSDDTLTDDKNDRNGYIPRH